MRNLLQVFKALSDETRLRILILLSQNDLCVCELVEILGMSQSRISHQLQILKNARLVQDRREGKWIIYSLCVESDDHYVAQIFGAVSVILNGDETIHEDMHRLKRCLQANTRDRCRGLGNND